MIQVPKLLIMQFSPASRHPHLSSLLLDTLNLFFSLGVRGRVSQPYETADKIKRAAYLRSLYAIMNI
jgi:hypothetical protein